MPIPLSNQRYYNLNTEVTENVTGYQKMGMSNEK